MRSMVNLRATAVLAILLVAGSAWAGVVTRHYEFPEPLVKSVGDYHHVEMAGAWSYGDPGQPVLPLAGVRLLLPPGEVVSDVRIVGGEKVFIGDGYVVEPGQPQYPLSFNGPHVVAEAAYPAGATYPASLHSEPVFGLFRGYGIANIALSPVEYDVDGGRLSYYSSMDVEIITEPDPDGIRSLETMIRHDDVTLHRLSSMVDNFEDSTQYASVERVVEQSRILDPGLGYDYIIVTSNAWDDYLTTFIDYQTERGFTVGMFTREFIALNYSGADIQTQIRNFIIDAYATWTPEYLLIVGDGEPTDPNGITARGFYNVAYGTTDTNIASDLYYSCLDGNWNADGDSYYGENGEEDFYPELAVGRVACSTTSDVTNFVNKVMAYNDSPIVSESDEALMVGELLWDDPTWGGDYKDEIKNGASTHGYTTVGFPPSMNVGTLYERDSGSWSITTLINLMENGKNIINHLGHCNNDYFMKMSSSNITSFDNDGTTHTLNFVYSQGCYGGSFDNRDPYNSYTSDCFAENFACDDDGAVAIVTNTRYGWGEHASTNGSSQYFDREFFDAIFGEHIYPLGHVNEDSKVDVLWAISYGANKWCYYELTLFGDPSMELWTDEPVAMGVSHDPTVMIGQPDFAVTVTDGAKGVVEGARVAIYTDDHSVLDSGVTDASGTVLLHPNAISTGTLHVKAMANNFLVSNTTANIIPTSGVYLALDSYNVDDDANGESNGNEDGQVGPGEDIELTVTLGNFGTDTAYGVTATLSSTSGRVVFRDDNEEFGDIEGGAFATCLDDFEFGVSSEAENGEVIPLTLTMTDSSRETWVSNFNLIVRAPELALQSFAVDDPAFGGNENGCPEPAEVIEVSATIENTGDASATGVTGTLSTTDPYVVINGAVGNILSLNTDSASALTPSFAVTILPSAPVDHDIVFDLAITADWGVTASGQFTVRTLGNEMIDDMESGVGLWTHGVVTSGFGDQWHMETSRYHSSSHSWKFGGSGTSDYGDSMDGALYMKPVCLGTDGEMTFWHWMEVEEESSSSAWDCGLVEITTDGGASWDVLYPDGGYTHTKNSNTANPLPEGTPCWSGTFSWRQETFDLTAYENTNIQIRFRFAADGYVTYEGWYVDDINLTSTGSPTGVEVGDEIPRTFALSQNVPNPFNPVTKIAYQLPSDSHVRIDVFNIAGKLVTTLVDENQQAGVKSVTWDGRNAAGEKVASGIYMYRLEAGENTFRKMMVLLK